MIEIPFHRLTAEDGEAQILAETYGRLAAGEPGGQIRRCQDWLTAHFGGGVVSMTGSCTQALELCGLLENIGPGDEVIVSSYTFPSTASAFALRGATLRFADVDADSLTLCPESVGRCLSARTKIIAFTHYLGVATTLPAVRRLAREHGICLVEDAACGLGGNVHGQASATVGDYATLSFHRSKSFGFDHGGALVVNRPQFDTEKLSWLLHKGTDREDFDRGRVSAYNWMRASSYYGMGELSAAVIAQRLQAFDAVQAERRLIWLEYHRSFTSLVTTHGVSLPALTAGSEPSYHGYYLRMPTKEVARALKAHLQRLGIEALTHYRALHLSPMGLGLGGELYDAPVATAASETVLRLPLYPGMRSAATRVAESVLGFFRAQEKVLSL